MSGGKLKLALGVALVALLVALAINLIEAQKTIANSFQQEISSGGSGSNPNSVYGGYGQSSFNRKQSSSSSFVAPVNQKRTQSYSSSSKRQQTNSVRQQQPVYQQQKVQESSYESSASQQSEADAEPASYGSVAGQPGTDFPAYTQVPKTSFSCDGLPYDYGMYADEETGCQAYHVCYNGRKDSFLCGVGTVFNQRILHCDYWYSVECGKSSQYYSSNAYMGSSQPEPGPAQASGSNYKRTEVSSSSVNRPVSYNNQKASSSSSFRQNTQQQVQDDGY